MSEENVENENVETTEGSADEQPQLIEQESDGETVSDAPESQDNSEEGDQESSAGSQESDDGADRPATDTTEDQEG